MRVAIFLLAAAVLSPAMFAQGDAKSAMNQCRKAFKPKPPEFKWPVLPNTTLPNQLVAQWSASRLKELRPVGAFHDTEVAKFLLKLAAELERDLIAVDAEREKLKKAIAAGFAAIQKSQKGKSGSFNTGSPGAQKYLKNSAEAGYYRTIRDGFEAECAEIHGQIEKLDADAIRYALGAAPGDKDQSLALKVAVVRAAVAQGDPMFEPLVQALEKAKQPAEIAAVVEGIGGFKTKARPVADKLIPLLSHEDAGVRERAALALSQIAVPAAIGPMIDLLAREGGIAKKRIAAALEVLTRQQFGTSVGAWQKWFAAEGAEYAKGGKELGGGKPSANAEFNKKNYYYGIPQDGKAILYVIDCSGSMVVSYKNPRFQKLDGGSEQPIPAGTGEVSRMDACRERLSEAIGQLTSDQRFNIVWYNFEPHLYKKAMQPATPKNIQAAQGFLKSLRADGATNIYDTMQLAFQATGRGSYDKAYGVDCDMIFLLTDGKPTIAGSSDGYDLVDNILVGVRKWNPLKRVVIHTIGIGKDLNTQFMQTLAVENGGEFRHEGVDPADKAKAHEPKPQDPAKPGAGSEPGSGKSR